jgi:hypothetical protein
MPIENKKFQPFERNSNAYAKSVRLARAAKPDKGDQRAEIEGREENIVCIISD